MDDCIFGCEFQHQKQAVSFFFVFNFLAGWVGLSRGGRKKQGRETHFKLIQFKTSIMVLSHRIADPIIEWFYLSPGH